MKKRIGLAAVLVLLLQVQAGIAGVMYSAHDFSILTDGGDGGFVADMSSGQTEICVFCHTPHNGVGSVTVNGSDDKVPLWNRSTYVGATFTMYSNPGSVHFTPAGKPSGHSLLCLSCHDGVSSMGAVLNNSVAGATIPFDSGIDTISGGVNMEINNRINITRNLSDDHPISFVYNNTLNPTGLKDPGNADGDLLGPELRLFNQKVECGSCHDPHDTTYGNFLRMSNASSAMCTKCHIK